MPHPPRWGGWDAVHLREGSRGPAFPRPFPPQGCALLTTRESALTQSICASLQRRISSGTVGGQLAGEEAHDKTCLISLRSDRQLQKVVENHRITDSSIPRCSRRVVPSSKQKKKTLENTMSITTSGGCLLALSV